jgi:hypothetical protein
MARWFRNYAFRNYAASPAGDLLPAGYFEPFDITYRKVTIEMKDRAAREGPTARAQWLAVLIQEFQNERMNWEDWEDSQETLSEYDKQFNGYLSQCQRLRPRYLHLVAGAYLHISYDLPRVMADNWPGGPKFPVEPQEQDATSLYLSLADIFPSVTERTIKDPRVTGPFLSWIARLIRPAGLLHVPGQWMQRLRSDAWLHASLLRKLPNRTDREIGMLRAMRAALEHVSASRPWSYAVLAPPSSALTTTTWIMVSPVSVLTVLGFVASLLLVTFILGYMMYQGFINLRLISELDKFADDFGARVSEYVSVAVYEPERLSRHLEIRAEELGIRSEELGTRSRG